MKFKTTTKDLRNNYRRIISIPYCAAQYLLRGRYPIAYNCGTYGWNYDVYCISDIIQGAIICTGYRSMPAGIDYDYKALHEAEQAASHGDAEKHLTEWLRGLKI